MMLGIAIDDTQSTKYDPPKEDIRLLSQITQQTQVSSLSLLKELLKQQNQEDVKIDESWLTMTQGAQQTNKPTSNMMVLKQLISKQSKSPPVSMKNLIKDVTTKIQPKIANQNDFKKFIKQQILNLNHYNSVKPQVQKIQISNYHSKQNSCHFQTSTRSISSEQLKMSFPAQPNKQQPSHKKSQTHYTEVASPSKKIEGKIQKLHTNSNQLQQPKSPEKFFKIYTSPTQTQNPPQTNINININQLNMNNLHIKSPQQQYKALLESPTLIKKKLINSCTADSQRIAKHSKNGSLSSKVQVQQVYVPNINQIKTRTKQK